VRTSWLPPPFSGRVYFCLFPPLYLPTPPFPSNRTAPAMFVVSVTPLPIPSSAHQLCRGCLPRASCLSSGNFPSLSNFQPLFLMKPLGPKLFLFFHFLTGAYFKWDPPQRFLYRGLPFLSCCPNSDFSCAFPERPPLRNLAPVTRLWGPAALKKNSSRACCVQRFLPHHRLCSDRSPKVSLADSDIRKDILFCPPLRRQ